MQEKKNRSKTCNIPLSLAIIFIFSFSSSFALRVTNFLSTSTTKSEVTNIFPFSLYFALRVTTFSSIETKVAKVLPFSLSFALIVMNFLLASTTESEVAKNLESSEIFSMDEFLFSLRERERQINNFGDLSVVITEAWLNFCSEEQKKVEPCSSYRIVYSNFVANLYFEVPNTSSKLWFLGRIDFIIFFNFNNI